MIVRQLTAILTHYRAPFHERVRAILGERGIEYDLLYGQPTAAEELKGDVTTLDWATPIRNYHINCGTPLVWQSAWTALQRSDLAIIGQENRLLVNYPMQILHRCRGGPKIALWGHGRNFQSRSPDGLRESWKRYWSTRCDWWFGYTQETRRVLLRQGFPDSRITIFDNAVDTTALRRLAAETTLDRLREKRRELGLCGEAVGVFVGGLYEQKRLSFLLESAELIRAQIPNFELLIIGGGPEMPSLKERTSNLQWVRVLGPRFAREKVEIMLLGQIFLMPGLLGLAILDASAVGLPVATTNYPFHSPELAYLQHGVNGVVTTNWQSARAYADQVISLFKSHSELTRLSNSARQISVMYSIERMASQFTAGVVSAVKAPRR